VSKRLSVVRAVQRLSKVRFAEELRTYRAAKQAEKLAQAAKGLASIQSVFKKLKKVGGDTRRVLGKDLTLGMSDRCRTDSRHLAIPSSALD
jgi:hypothetical protein